jgi:hypothetical protein
VGEVIAMADQALVQLACEQGDAIDSRVMAEPVAGDAHLAATAGEQDLFAEVWPSVDGDLAGGGIIAQSTEWNAGRGHCRRIESVRLY